MHLLLSHIISFDLFIDHKLSYGRGCQHYYVNECLWFCHFAAYIYRTQFFSRLGGISLHVFIENYFLTHIDNIFIPSSVISTVTSD